jgi:hypothetical protein
MGLSGWFRVHQTRLFKRRSAAMIPVSAWSISGLRRLWLPAFALSSLTACNEMPQRWTEDEIRDIAQDEAEGFMPLNAADAGSVDEAVNQLRQDNENLRAIVDAQGRQIDALNDSVRAQEDFMEGFVANYNRHTH